MKPHVDSSMLSLENLKIAEPAELASNTIIAYLIQEEGSPGLVKIGKSSMAKVGSRLGDLQTANPRALHLRGLIFMPEYPRGNPEAALHNLFYQYRLRGEWFFPAPEMEQWGVVMPQDEDSESVLFHQGFELGDKVGYSAAHSIGFDEGIQVAAGHLIGVLSDLSQLAPYLAHRTSETEESFPHAA